MHNPLANISRLELRLRSLAPGIVKAAEAAGHNVAITSDELDPKRQKLAPSMRVIVYDAKTRKAKKSDSKVTKIIEEVIAGMQSEDKPRDWYTVSGLTVKLKTEKKKAAAAAESNKAEPTND